MTCREAKSSLSEYLDGAVTGRQMQALGSHLAGCRDCRSEYELLQQTQKLVSGLGRPQAPADLPLMLRVAISREAAQARQPRFEGFRVRLENALSAFMLPATAGLVSAILIFALLIGLFTLPSPLRASDNDVPTMLYIPPELTNSPYSMGFGVNADSLAVQVFVGTDGRVYDSRILQGPADAQDFIPQLRNALIFTQFRPAMSFGRPIPSTTVLSFSKINVKG